MAFAVQVWISQEAMATHTLTVPLSVMAPDVLRSSTDGGPLDQRVVSFWTSSFPDLLLFTAPAVVPHRG